jgi:hypothetical protein
MAECVGGGRAVRVGTDGSKFEVFMSSMEYGYVTNCTSTTGNKKS